MVMCPGLEFFLKYRPVMKKKNNVAKEGQAFEAIEPGELSLSTSQFSHIDTNIGNPKFEVLLGGHWEYIRKCVVVVNTEEMQ